MNTKPVLVISIICFTGYTALAQQKTNSADIKTLKQQATTLMRQVDSLRKKAERMMVEVEKVSNNLSDASNELKNAQVNGIAKSKIDSLNQKITLLNDRKKWTEMRFDSILVLLDSSVGRLNAANDKLQAIKKQ